MSKLQLKVKDHDKNYIVLNNKRNLRLTLRNNREEIRDISSFGWRKVLDCAGSRYITIKINRILDSVLSDELLLKSAMLNSNNDNEISFNAKATIRLNCSVELYEGYYDPAAFKFHCSFSQC
ncbi:hypothetical protein [Wolbachia endosymbiont of Atemnus politus]|uniref:hypothetical protein n=1 Tax=Wolbachia endosymbiont of Atemnus politus TaxID=2682840 RepID=UPI001FE41CD5|nr:hypothetical protein [Wolbachia endosymbiont of Atemnus politus]